MGLLTVFCVFKTRDSKDISIRLEDIREVRSCVGEWNGSEVDVVDGAIRRKIELTDSFDDVMAKIVAAQNDKLGEG